MEDKYEYQIFDEDRKKKVQGIDGIIDLMAAIVDDSRELDPEKYAANIADLEKKYPRAAAYLKAQNWKWSPDMKQSALGRIAMERILDGDDPAAVLEEMESAWAAYSVAQEG